MILAEAAKLYRGKDRDRLIEWLLGYIEVAGPGRHQRAAEEWLAELVPEKDSGARVVTSKNRNLGKKEYPWRSD